MLPVVIIPHLLRATSSTAPREWIASISPLRWVFGLMMITDFSFSSVLHDVPRPGD